MERGYLSVSDDSEDDSGMEHAFQGGGGASDTTEYEEGTGEVCGEGQWYGECLCPSHGRR